MKLNWKSMFLGTTVLLAFIASVPASVSVDYDHDVDFSKYKTFAIVFAEGQVNLEKTSPLVHQTILEDIKKNLVLYGLKEVKTDPDVTMTYHVATEEETVLDTTGHGYGFGPGWGPGWGYAGGGWGAGTTQVMNFTIGNIIIDAYDTATKLAIWRGMLRETIPDNVKKARKQVSRDVNKIFEKWAKQHEEDLESAEKAKK